MDSVTEEVSSNTFKLDVIEVILVEVLELNDMLPGKEQWFDVMSGSG